MEISANCFNLTRSENHVKNQWYSASFKKFVADEFGPGALHVGDSDRKNDASSLMPTKRKQKIDLTSTLPVPKQQPDDEKKKTAEAMMQMADKEDTRKKAAAKARARASAGNHAHWNARAETHEAEEKKRKAPMPKLRLVTEKPEVKKKRKVDIKWTDQEDAILSETVLTSSEQPFKSWTSLVNLFPGRNGKKIRDRWVNHLDPNLNLAPFSREDNILLWEGRKTYGNKWVEISANCFNLTRSENHVKNQWYSASFKKFVAGEFGPEAYLHAVSKKVKEAKSNLR